MNLDDKLGIFEYDPSVSAPDLIKDYVDEMGFEASLKHPGGVEENSSTGKALTGRTYRGLAFVGRDPKSR